VFEEVNLSTIQVKLEDTMIHCDNHSGITFSENLMFHDRSKHIDIRYHFIQDSMSRGTLRLEYIYIYEHIVDIFNKALRRKKIMKFRYRMGLRQNPFLAKREC
jgi:kynurenine formamidase